MSNKNLPILMVMPRDQDKLRNTGFPKPKLFEEKSKLPELQESIVNMFGSILDYYKDVFASNEFVPAVGKIIVKPEAIAKSYKPNDLCRECPIIGSEELNEIYIKVSQQSIIKTIGLVKNPPTQAFEANLTVIDKIMPVTAKEKISESLVQISTKDDFERIKNKIKIRLFDFGDDFNNNQIMGYVMNKFLEFGYYERQKMVEFGDEIKLIKVSVDSYEDVVKLASINGVKSIDFFQEYSLPQSEPSYADMEAFLGDEYSDSEVRIGIIDGGISDDNSYLAPYIVAREEYVHHTYRNPSHATFIASIYQYGNLLNDIPVNSHKRFKFVDVIAIPNENNNYGDVDTICEDELMEIIEEVIKKHASLTKIWNLSLGIEDNVCSGSMSDLGIFLDYVQDKYQVQIFVSSGNIKHPPFRKWPPSDDIGEHDRIVSPADSVRVITVGSLALNDSKDSIVKKDEPSPFSRRGPGANYIVKPDIVDYGGNYSTTNKAAGLGIKGLDSIGNIVERCGTSYSTPRAAQKFASVYDEMVLKDLMLTKAMLIHSARMNSRGLLDKNPDYIKYYGFGMPSAEVADILFCSDAGDEVTLVFKQKIIQGTHLEMYDFPYPSSLTREGKCYGEIGMTLVYNPILDRNYGREYCRTNIDAKFGTYKQSKETGKIAFKGRVPLENAWDEKYEKVRVEHGFKWSPIKSYYQKIGKRGIDVGDGWKIRLDLTPRGGLTGITQEFVLIVTIKDPDGNDIYSEVVNGLKLKGFVTTTLETRLQVRQR